MNLRTVYRSWEDGIRAIVTQLLAFETANTTALDLKADIASPTFTGTPAAPTAAAGTNTTQIATTAHVKAADDLKANIASPTFTGTVTVPTPFTLGAVSVTATGTELNYVGGVTSNIQDQLNAKAASAIEAVTAPTLVNGWVDFGVGRMAAGYWKDPFGVVHLQGLIKDGTTTAATTIFTLPSGYRPTAPMRFVVINGVTEGQVDITGGGAVQIITGSNAALSLDGITFRTN